MAVTNNRAPSYISAQACAAGRYAFTPPPPPPAPLAIPGSCGQSEPSELRTSVDISGCPACHDFDHAACPEADPCCCPADCDREKGYRPTLAEAACADCGVGRYSAASSDQESDCIGCAAGTFSAAAAIGIGGCVHCGAGQHSALGSGKCADCPTGSVTDALAEAGGTACTRAHCHSALLCVTLIGILRIKQNGE
jgi:hypothetical protein